MNGKSHIQKLKFNFKKCIATVPYYILSFNSNKNFYSTLILLLREGLDKQNYITLLCCCCQEITFNRFHVRDKYRLWILGNLMNHTCKNDR